MNKSDKCVVIFGAVLIVFTCMLELNMHVRKAESKMDAKTSFEMDKLIKQLNEVEFDTIPNGMTHSEYCRMAYFGFMHGKYVVINTNMNSSTGLLRFVCNDFLLMEDENADIIYYNVDEIVMVGLSEETR